MVGFSRRRQLPMLPLEQCWLFRHIEIANVRVAVHSRLSRKRRAAKYGCGPEQVVAGAHKNPLSKHAWVRELLGVGDIDRVLSNGGVCCARLRARPILTGRAGARCKKLAKGILRETESPTLTDLPPLEYHQTKRVDHRLILRRQAFNNLVDLILQTGH